MNSLIEIVRAVLAILGVVKDTEAIEAAISETQTNRKPINPAHSTPIKKSDREQPRRKFNLTNMDSPAQEEQPSLLEKGETLTCQMTLKRILK
ncbi:hypothetical protein Pcinc_014311 [Petrolisthes cinctipes]|uniref:Uncharacterized protein n=1 Tax=Petrolisthes cinctipes TaxID=88211 RepID=A0AAE1KQT4_PETCI|nr:hypothetical protein Pcinc_014311 [Petrolisthes cinctipes]